ncbi:DNA topoisomerase VI subunit B [Candidatus Geothermarchaeota archaeon ex4572_27]|nr:MAG: DNA topoisomerase VI subunit B [Candidatus Geothermarchaeota archaeon ex4572_27]
MRAVAEEKWAAISPADFFYRNREIAGFENPVRSTYTIFRELLENSMDACETAGILPDVYVRLRHVEGGALEIKVEDNGRGVPKRYVKRAFAQVLFGSKYTLRQTRGIFGLGGKMAVLYGQITTNTPVHVTSSTGGVERYSYKLMVDIERNEPVTKEEVVERNPERWRGTVVRLRFHGDYSRARGKIVDYLKHVAIIEPYSRLTFVDPDGVLYFYRRKADRMPKPPEEVPPHPQGVDVETLRRLAERYGEGCLLDFLVDCFHKVGRRTALKFLSWAGLDPNMDVRELLRDEELLPRLVKAMNGFSGWLPPDPSCLSPIGPELLEIGIREELKPEFVAVVQRRPSAYSGHPFIVEVAIAYGGGVPTPSGGEVNLYRYANKIPLLYDVHSDVSMKVIKRMKWWRYKVNPESMPIAFLVHVCSTKVPYKTVGKEFIADRPEIEYEIEWGLKEAARKLRAYLSRKQREETLRRRKAVIMRYLPYIAKFAADLCGAQQLPDYEGALERTLMGEGEGVVEV